MRVSLGLFTAGRATMTRDEEHLRLLSIFHYVVGGLAALFALFPIFHLIIGLFMIFAPDKMFHGKEESAPALIGWIIAALILTTGRFLARRKHYQFCLVMGGVECLFMPFGTVLGVFTILVLVRESVKQLFGAHPPVTPANVQQ
jgi:hypothetical protein